MSSLHYEGEVDVTNPKKKPAMILEYNATKKGVDTADKMTGDGRWQSTATCSISVPRMHISCGL